MFRASRWLREPLPPKVVVLSMLPQGGPMAQALVLLGYTPYTFEDTFRKGHIASHPLEWQSVLEGRKGFDRVLLEGPIKRVEHMTLSGAAVKNAERLPDYDALVGPPATLAFEAILKTCPRSTRVVLVEEPDKLEWERQMDLLVQPLLRQTKRSTRYSPGRHLHAMVERMFEVRQVVVRGARAHSQVDTYDRARASAALQTSHLSPAACLDLFEAHVREVTPRDRLLVYRVGDGWEPLCDFLRVPVPRDPATREVVPFPPRLDAVEGVEVLRSGLSRLHRFALVLVLLGVSFMIALVTPLKDQLLNVLRLYRQAMLARLNAYVEEAKEDKAGGRVTLRQLLVASKAVTMDFERKFREEGGLLHITAKAFRQLTGREAPPSPPSQV
ncbi:hypothetical protein STCU_06621 [Strigomonas culicis]|uniref:Uncharacterized protein n=1 Tax=Strigomonas culicis TaxID=28005 RepID=S9U4E6_9TRYP|nr:hypothetical protein STCU_06621 [Strigomonas culicis]|eukprot:EPY25622.1 hypothetical protein STCU_06621 [Strigomonas culicis]